VKGTCIEGLFCVRRILEVPLTLKENVYEREEELFHPGALKVHCVFDAVPDKEPGSSIFEAAIDPP